MKCPCARACVHASVHVVCVCVCVCVCVQFFAVVSSNFNARVERLQFLLQVYAKVVLLSLGECLV